MMLRWWERLLEALTLFRSEESPARPMVPVQETLTLTARLPSASEGLRFDAGFVVNASLYPAGENERTRVLARLQAVLVESAYEHAERFALGDHGRAETELFHVLNGLGNCGEARIQDTTVRVTLTVDEEDIALERRRELVGQRSQLAREEHRARMLRVDELVTDVLRDHLTARVWWFAQNQERWGDIRAVGEALDPLVSLRAQPSDGRGVRSGPGPSEAAGPPGAFGEPILEEFLSGVSGKEKQALLQRLTDILDAYGRQDLVTRLHESWGDR